MKSLKSKAFSLASSLMLTFAIGSVAEAATFRPGDPPVPTSLQEYIDLAETGTLPDPLDPNKLVLWSGGGERFTFLERAQDNGGQFSIFDVLVPTFNGPPLHFHTRENEWFYVVEGNVFLQVADELIAGEPGTLVYGPATIIHSFKNKASDPARMLLYYEPVPEDDPNSVGNIERFFIEVGQEVVDPINPPAVDIPRLLSVAPDFGLTFPKTFGFEASEFTGDEVTIRRSGIPDASSSVVLGLSNGLDIPLTFEIGEVFKTVTLPSEVGNQTLDLILKDPSPGSLVGLIDQKAVRTANVPESSFPIGLLAFGMLGAGLISRGIKTHSEKNVNSSKLCAQKS
ncbi:MAG: cupin domain-containing protein [Nostocaceae cyanobacterium]|nr:cupin domain-containing protein [Nostocaceae cyanobacterium]